MDGREPILNAGKGEELVPKPAQRLKRKFVIPSRAQFSQADDG